MPKTIGFYQITRKKIFDEEKNMVMKSNDEQLRIIVFHILWMLHNLEIEMFRNILSEPAEKDKRGTNP
jgi:hypothetical protein